MTARSALLDWARRAVELDAQVVRWPDGSRLWRAIALSPSIEICEALLCGEAVPLDRLDPVWAERFGIRR